MKKFLMLFLVLIIVLLVGACEKNSTTNNTQSVNTHVETIESYLTEELQCALGLIKIRQEMADEVADVKSIQIRSIPKVEKHTSDSFAFATYITYDITYKNENGGTSVIEVPTHIENALQTVTIYGELAPFPYLPNSDNKPFDGTINIHNVNKVIEKYSLGDIQSVLTRRQQEAEE